MASMRAGTTDKRLAFIAVLLASDGVPALAANMALRWLLAGCRKATASSYAGLKPYVMGTPV